jgi:hypothetical protein
VLFNLQSVTTLAMCLFTQDSPTQDNLGPRRSLKPPSLQELLVHTYIVPRKGCFRAWLPPSPPLILEHIHSPCTYTPRDSHTWSTEACPPSPTILVTDNSHGLLSTWERIGQDGWVGSDTHIFVALQFEGTTHRECIFILLQGHTFSSAR